MSHDLDRDGIVRDAVIPGHISGLIRVNVEENSARVGRLDLQEVRISEV